MLALLAEGLTNRLIAERLVVSEHTVHRHVTSILRKLDLPVARRRRAARRAPVARSAIRAGRKMAGAGEDGAARRRTVGRMETTHDVGAR